MILDGKLASSFYKEKIKNEIKENGYKIGLVVIIVGDDPASKIYVSSKEKAATECGINSIVKRFEANVSQDKLIKYIKECNKDNDIHGILVQLPLPSHINENEILNTISPDKDVDCFHPYNVGRLFIGNSIIEPCTPKGIIALLDYYKIPIEGKRAVVIGRSNIVGKPLSIMLLKRNATVTICHSKTNNIEEIVKTGDIVVAAIGKPEYIKGNWLKEGAIVIDVGINRVQDISLLKGYKIVGDVEFEEAEKIAYAITPVPGGIGPMTIAMLLTNTLELYKNGISK